ncbi:MAG: CmpA/NrtA family ABC transporter substrate-binding protein [Pseudanabaenaceae cyanobacterium bins.68]|nr:CmpA/NrtA family ABC transporter substrate-binding protein [Pseudanabaenaceae cyanobacterium bins.68]
MTMSHYTFPESISPIYPRTRESPVCSCGGNHLPEDHAEFLAGMPHDPINLIDDLVKMGHYNPEAVALADRMTQTELMEALFLESVAGNNDIKQQLVRDMMREAGGLDAAFTAAFGPQAAEFFGNTVRRGDFSRRRFLKQITLAAGLLSLGFSTQAALTSEEGEAQGKLEKTKLRVGFIPITCATPIIMSKPLGFYTKYGLDVELVKMPSWAAVRDSAIAGELDAYHMLSPMPISISLGLGSTMFPIRLASIENINGQAITIAKKYEGKIKGPADFKGFTIGVPFPFSMHNLLIRYYLATGGLNPDKDVKISPVPPPDSVAKLSVGDIDAMLMPDPFNQRAVYEKAGFIHMLSKELWAGHPCCAFAASQKWIDANPNTFRALNKAIIDGCGYARNDINRKSIAKAIAPRQYLNQPEPVIAAVLTGRFDNGLGKTVNVPDRISFDPYPWHSFAYWISSQMVRWNLLPSQKANYQEIAKQIFMDDLARALGKEVGQTPPSRELRVEKLKFDTFDPAKASAYLEAQRKKFGV